MLAAVRDFLLGASPWVPAQERYRLGSVTDRELTRVLAVNNPGARIEAVTAQLDSKGTTDRARLHLAWNATGRAAQLPSSVFAKYTPSHTMSRLIVSTFGCHSYEARFFQTIHPAVADLTVRPYVSRYGPGGRYLLLTENLSARAGVHLYGAEEVAPLAHIEAVVDVLAKLHGRFWRSPRFTSDLAWLALSSQRPGSAVTNRLFRWSERRFMRQDRDVPGAVRRATKLFVDNQAALMRAWESMPPTLCHGDTHLGNTYGLPAGGAGVYDWQVCQRMCGLSDFAYFMTHSVATDLRRQHERNLLARYLDGVARAGAGGDVPSFDEAFDHYRALTINGWMAVMVTLAAGGMQPDDRMEVAAERAINTLSDLDVEDALTARL